MLVDDGIGMEGVDGAPGVARGDDRRAGCHHVRLLEAVPGGASARERGDLVIPTFRRLVEVRRADRDHVGIVGGLGDRPDVRPAVARGDHDRDARGPGALDRCVERIDRVRLDRIRAEREVQHPDPVLAAVRDDPLDGGDHDRDVGGPVGAGHLDRDQLRAGGDAAPLAPRGTAVARDHPREMGAVPVLIVSCATRREVHTRDDAVAEVLVTGDARIDHRHRDAASVDPARKLAQPDRLPPHEAGVEDVVDIRAGGGHLDACVDGESGDRGVSGEHRQTIVRHGRREPADQGERTRDVATHREDPILGDAGGGVRLVDQDRAMDAGRRSVR